MGAFEVIGITAVVMLALIGLVAVIGLMMKGTDDLWL